MFTILKVIFFYLFPAIFIMGFLVFALPPALSSLDSILKKFLPIIYKRRANKLEIQEKETLILQLARQNDGKISVSQIVKTLRIDETKANEILRNLMTKDYADIAVTEDGIVTYNISLPSSDFKKKAEDIL